MSSSHSIPCPGGEPVGGWGPQALTPVGACPAASGRSLSWTHGTQGVPQPPQPCADADTEAPWAKYLCQGHRAAGAQVGSGGLWSGPRGVSDPPCRFK